MGNVLRFLLQKEVIADTQQELTFMETIDEAKSEDPKMIAAVLRAIANRLDPPRDATRKGLPTMYKGRESNDST